MTRIAPTPEFHPGKPQKAFENQDVSSKGLIYEVLKPVIYLLRFMGIYPVSRMENGRFEVTSQLLMYSAAVFLVEVGLIGKFSMYVNYKTIGNTYCNSVPEEYIL